MQKIKVLSDEQEEQIVELYKNGTPLNQLYRKYKYSYSVIARVLEKKGVQLRPFSPRKQLTDAEIKKITTLYNSGETLKNVAKRVGYSSNLCKRILTENDIPIRMGKCKQLEKAKGRKISEIKQGEPIDCDTEGRRCRFRAGTNEIYLCDYCAINKRIRGDDPHACTKYIFK